MLLEVSEEVGAVLNSFVDPAGRTHAQIVRDAVMEYVSEQQGLLVAVQRMKEHREGKAESVSLEELMDRYGVDR